MSVDKKLETVMTFMTALQSGDLELAARVSSPDLVVSGLLTRPLSQREFLALQGELLISMSDFSYNLTDIKRSGDDVQAFISVSGTQTNDLSLPMVGPAIYSRDRSGHHFATNTGNLPGRGGTGAGDGNSTGCGWWFIRPAAAGRGGIALDGT